MAWKTKLRILHSKICHPIVLFFSTFFFPFFAVAVTNHPSNESELQIYRVLQRANLLSYYDTFIAQGKYHIYKKPTTSIWFLSVGRSYDGATERNHIPWLKYAIFLFMSKRVIHHTFWKWVLLSKSSLLVIFFLQKGTLNSLTLFED